MENGTLIKLWAMTMVTILMIVDALTWKIDHALWSLGITIIAGLAGYEVGLSVGKNKPRD